MSWHSLIKSSLLHPLLNLMTVKQDFQHYLPSTAGASNIIVVGLVFLTMVPNCLKLDNQQSCHPILPMFPHCTSVHLFSFSFFLSFFTLLAILHAAFNHASLFLLHCKQNWIIYICSPFGFFFLFFLTK